MRGENRIYNQLDLHMNIRY